MNDKLFSAISLCRKAGKLCMGMDVVKEKAFSGEAKLVLLASDVSERSERQARFACGDCGVRVAKLPYTMEELSRVTGKAYGILAICDGGFSRMIEKLLGS
ncbi:MULTISPECIES: L7Ae/L30e/S12e/Gadd45 family ribosomal protein [Anaerotruncus]|jgi:ribosomal protein L7Ae-like RNA K-turn-binding protein|uniref:L7Ae/L30e/S12e/Gadd45 family ribosomal protein n=1 Tax=Anaerotruncus TaxID=244127 RepID=UPI000E476C94|nr:MULTISPECIES: ribosomal L7Ae/L30e/S12e/Gadd45 family protein [Anaerotruncus]RGX56863.1 50S ribosomal protein L7 [Anaerotruncus sp. AF02-27]